MFTCGRRIATSVNPSFRASAFPFSKLQHATRTMSNKAAFLTGTQQPLEVKPAPYPQKPKDNEIVIKSKAVAINPFDFAMQMFGPAVFPFLQFPCIIGEDVAGEVEAVGAGVTRYKLGDRVAALTMTAFQEHVTVPEHMALSVPDSIPFEQAAALPLALSVAAQALFGTDYLALRLPTAAGTKPEPTGKTVLIWGGSTSVGSNAIQLAVAAGYEVVTTASPANFDYVKKLGASHVFDYNSPTVKADLVALFKDKSGVGAIANGAPNPAGHATILDACTAVVTQTPSRAFLACTMALQQGPPAGVEAKFVQSFMGPKDVALALAIYGDFVPKALATGSFVATPKAQVAGSGLESVQGGIELVKRGVSASKIVVTL